MTRFLFFIWLCVYCLSAIAESEAFKPLIDSIDPKTIESIREGGFILEESPLIDDSLDQIQKKTTVSLSRPENPHRLVPAPKQGDYDSKFGPQVTDESNALFLDPFAEDDALPFIFNQPSADSELGFNPLLESKEFILSMEIFEEAIVADEALREIVDGTVNMALRINEAWNTLDQKVTHKVYQSVGYFGFDKQFSTPNPRMNNQGVEFKNLVENYAAPNAEIRRFNGEPEGFFAYLIHFPKLFTVSNLLWMLFFLLAVNVLYRVMRFFLLRI